MIFALPRKIADKSGEHVYLVFRMLVALMFFMHGGQKLFGWFGDNGPVQLASLMGVAGLVEVIVGLAVFFGLLTRIMAFFGAGQMLVAYVFVHAGQGWNPLVNKGELALLYLVAFAVIFIKGSGKWGLEQMLMKRELF